jgi:hypothetical protein
MTTPYEDVNGLVQTCTAVTRVGRKALDTAVEGALGEIYLFAAFAAEVRFFEFVRKNFFGFAALRAFACKGFQVLKLLITGTMLWCGHDNLPNSFLAALETIISVLLSYISWCCASIGAITTPICF